MAGFKSLYDILKLNIRQFIQGKENKQEALNDLILEMENQTRQIESQLYKTNAEKKVYSTVNLQASQLKEQLDELHIKLHEAYQIKSTLPDVPVKEVISKHRTITCFECDKNKGIIDAEFDRLMNEIKEKHNLI